MNDHEMALAKRAASKLRPAKLEDFITPTPKKRKLAVGVYHHGNGFRARVRQPDGTYRYVCFPTYEEAAKARTESLNTL